MNPAHLVRLTCAAALFCVLPTEVEAVGPPIAQDQYCTINFAISSSTRCFDTLAKAEGYLRTEPAPAVGRKLLVKTRVSGDIGGKVQQFHYAVKNVQFEAHVGDNYYVSDTVREYPCKRLDYIPGVDIPGCSSETEAGNYFKSLNSSVTGYRYVGDYIPDTPKYWQTSGPDNAGRHYVSVQRNVLPEGRRYLIPNYSGVEPAVWNEVTKIGYYRCPKLYLGQGRAWDSQPQFWPNICANYETGTITKTSHQHSTCPAGKVGNPCVASTGNKEYRETDFSWEGLDFVRAYNSIRDMTLYSGMDDSWSHTFAERLRVPSADGFDAYWIRADGYYEVFNKLSNDRYRGANTVGAVLYREPDATAEANGRWRLVQVSGRISRFDAAGRLIRIEDGARTYRLSYCLGDDFANRVCDTPEGTLYKVTSASGRTLRFSYTPKMVRLGNDPEATSPVAQISSIAADGLTLAGYRYDDYGRMTSAILGDQALSQGRSYVYADASRLCKAANGTAAANCDPADFPYHLTAVVNENGIEYARYTYDAYGRVTSSEHAGGAGRVSLSYLANGKVEATLPSGATRKYEFNDEAYRNPLTINDVASDGSISGTTQSIYSGTRLASSISPRGNRTDYAYDDHHRTGQTEGLTAAGTTTPLTRRTQTDWHPTLAQPTERRVYDATNALVAKETLTYNDRGQVLTVSKIDPVSNAVRTTTTAYCETADASVPASNCPVVGLVKSIDGPRSDVNDVTTYSYYAADAAACATSPAACAYRKGDLWKATNALGQIVVENLRYDIAGRVLSSLDANAVLTDTEYDARGRIAAIKVRGANDSVESDDRITRYEYWPAGTVKKVTLPDGVVTNYAYDGDNRLTEVADADGNTIRYTLDASGNRKQEDTRAADGTLKRTLSRVYNQLNQLQANKDASQNATVYRYDADGNQDRTTDALGRVTDQNHDALNRLARTLQDVGGLNVETKFQYDAMDRLTKVTDPKGLDTVYTYDGFGDQVRLTSPDTGITHYTYNAAGKVATKQDANDPEPHRYTYDALGRPKNVFYTAAGAADVEYDHDTVNSVCGAGETFAIGRVSAMRADGTELKYCYDRFGQVVRKVQIVAGKSFSLSYTYALGGQLSTVTYPDGATVDYVRDSRARIKEIGVLLNGGVRTVLLSNATYEPSGPVAGWTYGNGRVLSRTYDLDYRAKTILDNASGGLSLGYSYNTAGELTELKDGLQSAFQAKYDYDTLGRLTVTRDGSSNPLETYTYDGTGNRKSLLHGGVTDTYVYPADSHRLSSVAGVSRGYDAVGNTVNIGGAAREFVYNASDRLSQFKQAGVVKASYRYNAIGERVGTTVGLIDTYTVYDEAGNWVGDYDAGGGAKQQAVWLGNIPVGLVGEHALLYVQSDHMGTPRAVVDPSRNVEIWAWSAKGEVFGSSAPNEDPDLDGMPFVLDMRYPGQRYDASSGVNYNYYRDYDFLAGRYLQSDLIGLSGGISTYAYVGSSPLDTFDPNGLNGVAVGVARGVFGWIALDTAVPEPTDLAWPKWAAYGAAAAIAGGVLWAANEKIDDEGADKDTGKVCKPAIADVQGRDFCEQMTLAEAKAGAGFVIMQNMADEPRLVAHYGPGPWFKKEYTRTCPGGRRITIHYFSNGLNNVELKFKNIGAVP